jgi:hypothetical protein
MRSRNNKTSDLTLFLLAVFAYSILAVVVTWPLAINFGTHLLGSSTDSLLHYWNGWWVKQAIDNGQNPFYSPLIFYPEGISLVTHNIAWFNVLFWILFESIIGGIQAYNLSVLFSLVLCGLAVFWLIYKMTDNRAAAFLSGFIYLAWPFRLTQLDHPNILATQWIPVFFLFLIYAIQRGRWRDALLAGLFFALVGYTRWQLLIAVITMALVYFLASRRFWLPNGQRYKLIRLAAGGALAMILLLPPAILLINQLEIEGASVNLLREGEDTFMQTDVLAYFTPPGSNPLVGKVTEELHDHYYPDRSPGRRFTAYVGFTALILALLGIKYKGRDSLPWVLMAAILILLALGPLLRVNGQIYERVPTFYRLLSPLGVFQLMRVPDRFNVFLALPVSVLAGFGAAGLFNSLRTRNSWAAPIAFVLIAMLILAEYLTIPVPLSDGGEFSSPYFERLANQPGEFAVLNVPINPLRSKVFMYNQTIHQRPIVQGNISRVPDEQYTFIESIPLLSEMRLLVDTPPDIRDISRKLSSLNQENIRFIIINKNLLQEDRIDLWRHFFIGHPRYEDDTIAVYATEPKAGLDFELIHELVPGLGPINYLISSRCLNPGSLMEVDLGWGSTKPIGQNFNASLSLVNVQTGREFELAEYPVSEGWPTGEWPADTLAWGFYEVTLPEPIPSGEYQAVIQLVDPETGQSQGNKLALPAITVQEDVCNLAQLPEAIDVNATFGNEIRLLEYDLVRSEDELDFMLYWRPDHHPAIDYKIFIHVFDPETGIPVAQSDFMPRGWVYPTSFWWPGEVIEDETTVSLVDIPPGNYGIAIGIYDPVTGERLPVVNSAGIKLPDGRLILDEIVEISPEND